MLTFSRGAMIAIVAGVALLLLLRGLYKWLLLLVAGGIGVLIIGIATSTSVLDVDIQASGVAL